mmetsp:Transcript_2365/g.3589  ORF Transcript_2365/g.3589 Transcript_2365/m.3589 type:complete len:149 (+) Transcript_2365:1-447(+)
MNLVTGVLVDRAKQLTSEDRQIQLIDQVKQVFKQAGEEDKEFLTWSEYCKLMDHASMRNVLEALTIDKAQAGMLFHLVEKSKDKEVTVEEFVKGTAQFMGSAKAFDLAVLQQDIRSQSKYLHIHTQRLNARLDRLEKQLQPQVASDDQ